MTAFPPETPRPALGSGRNGGMRTHSRRQGERPLSAHSSDLRGDEGQRARCADNGLSRNRDYRRRGQSATLSTIFPGLWGAPSSMR